MKPGAGAWHCHRQRDKGAPSSPSARTDSTESFEVWCLGSWPPVVGLKVYSAFANRLDTPRESRRSPPPSRLLFRVSKDTPWSTYLLLQSALPRLGLPRLTYTLGLQRRWRQTWGQHRVFLLLDSNHLRPGLHAVLPDTRFQEAV